ncbi:MAG: hypothetical protein DRP47_03395 [Candidatus Zixiibacteriota bacterium]|nr:MAG: hypothetical protein DRP47_03395 [candidate division Zixibacteria bacterium]
MNRFTTIILVVGFIFIAGCSKETPSRDHIPVLKEQVFQLQEAIKNHSRAAIDSLLSPDILSAGQNSDSLLNFCWGYENDFPFERLGDCEIAYTDKHAIADCFVMDSTNMKDRPVRLIFIYQHDLWLLKRFEPRDTIASQL